MSLYMQQYSTIPIAITPHFHSGTGEKTNIFINIFQKNHADFYNAISERYNLFYKKNKTGEQKTVYNLSSVPP